MTMSILTFSFAWSGVSCSSWFQFFQIFQFIKYILINNFKNP